MDSPIEVGAMAEFSRSPLTSVEALQTINVHLRPGTPVEGLLPSCLSHTFVTRTGRR